MLTLTYAYTLLHKHINTCILAGINKCVCTCACSSHTDVLKQKCILTYRGDSKFKEASRCNSHFILKFFLAGPGDHCIVAQPLEVA